MYQALVSPGQQVGTYVMLFMAVLARIAVSSAVDRPEARARFRFACAILVMHLVLLLATVSLEGVGASHAGGMRIGAALVGTLASVTLASVITFEGLVLRFVRLPRIVPDLLTMVVASIALMRTSARLGFELSGVIATSAVLTAVIGLALQDTLGNALGGLSLQVDGSIKVGDYVRLGEVTGRVSEMHWRYTAIETPSWDTVIVPNRELMRAQVAVIGRRRDRPLLRRRSVAFRVDFRSAPNDVIQVVDDALRAQQVANVASDPAPFCVAEDFEESQIRYEVRYWVDPDHDAITDTLVRSRVYYALARAGISLAIPAQRRFVTADDEARRAHKQASERARRVAALRPSRLFAPLNDEDLTAIADRLERVPFAQGETITREGASDKYLYMIRSGTVSVRVGGEEEQHEVGRLQAGDFFGEIAILKGERRTATSVALTDVECYRLDAAGFGAMYEGHAQIADYVARVIAERETGLIAARERLGARSEAALRSHKEHAFAAKIRDFLARI